jgi:hypothetical protein
MTIYYTTQEYVRSHGKQPRGYGMWGFFIDRAGIDRRHLFWYTGKFAEAKRAAYAYATGRKAMMISVAP